MDLDAFLKRTGRSKADLLRDLGLDPKSSLISAYIKGRSKPSYEIVEKLIELGIRDDEILDKKHAEMLRANSEISREAASNIFDSPEFRAKVEKILVDIQSSVTMPDFSDSNNLLDQRIKGNSPTEKI